MDEVDEVHRMMQRLRGERIGNFQDRPEAMGSVLLSGEPSGML